jgi:2-succinyl-5-enolpyruvyl-6-hydroxy-3-cyclohexene-1-carboxylate synthase
LAQLSTEPGSPATGAAVGPGWARQWADAERVAQGALDDLLGEGGPLALSEPGVARAVVAGLPEGGVLVVSSSMPVRDVEWYGKPRHQVDVVANRGVNGIDGVLSTAVGVAAGSGAPVVALLGDLAFLYDAGALLGAVRRQLALTVVVVDNDGGGIFSFLSQAAALPPGQFERYWGTPHGADITAIAAAYGAEVTEVGDRAALGRILGCARRPGVRVALVRSERAANVAAHERLHAAVAAAMGSR